MTATAFAEAVQKLACSFVISGEPIPQGSHKGFAIQNKRTGKTHVNITEDNPKTKSWRRHIVAVARGHVGAGWKPLDCPMAISLAFTMPKPPSYPKRRRTWPSASFDIDKLVRNLLDGLTAAGVITNDARFVELRAAKHFPGEHPDSLPLPGVRVAIWTISAQPSLDGVA